MRCVRNYFSLDRRANSIANGVSNDLPSLAVQSQKDEADINVIVRNFGLTGKLPVGVKVPSYGDFTVVNDYRSAIDAVRAADAAFMKVPSELRARLENNPQKFLEYCADAGNLEEMRKLGLAPVPVVVPAAS